MRETATISAGRPKLVTSTFANNAVRASAACLLPPAFCLLPPHSSPRHVPPRSIIRQMSEQAGRQEQEAGAGGSSRSGARSQAGDTRLLQLRLLVALAATSANEISRHLKAFVSLMRRKAMSSRSGEWGRGEGGRSAR